MPEIIPENAPRLPENAIGTVMPEIIPENAPGTI